MPCYGRRVLSPAEVRTLLRVAEAILPAGGGLPLGGREVGVPERFVRHLEAVGEPSERQIRLLLRLPHLAQVYEFTNQL